MWIIKYTFDAAVVAMVSNIPAKSRIPVNDVTFGPHKGNKEDGDGGNSVDKLPEINQCH